LSEIKMRQIGSADILKANIDNVTMVYPIGSNYNNKIICNSLRLSPYEHK